MTKEPLFDETEKILEFKGSLMNQENDVPDADEKLNEFMGMIAYMRPAFSDTEEEFIQKYIDPLDVESDAYGNLYKVIGEEPIIWSCHTDTVHLEEGMQNVTINDYGIITSDSNCLGADDTSGVWLMMEMIRAKMPGVYIFHRAEERGAKGSGWISKNEGLRDYLKNFKYAIAFDRRGTDSLVTHQMGQRCCSEEFAKSLVEQIPGLNPDDTGAFTDTYSYIDIIPECTNISVGYYDQHTPKERQNWKYLLWLRSKILELDYSKFVCARDPSVTEYNYNNYYRADGAYRSFGRNYHNQHSYGNEEYSSFDEYIDRYVSKLNAEDELRSYVEKNPDKVAHVLFHYYDMKLKDFEDFENYGI